MRGPRRLLRVFSLVLCPVLLVGIVSCASGRGGSGVAAPSGVALPRAPTPQVCFPVEGLSEADRARAESVLLALGDGEGLYTLADGLKPISSGQMVSVKVAPDLDVAGLDDLDRLRRAVSRLSCGEIGVFVHVFTSPSTSATRGTQRQAEVVVYHRASVATAVRRHAAFFGLLGITPEADPREVLAAVENAPRADRWRGYGYLYGYPDDAVDFFVRAGLEGDAQGTVVPRDFRRIETWKKFPDTPGGPPTVSAFVFAVPKGAAESDAERTLRAAAAPIYQAYAAWRSRHGDGAPGAAVTFWRSRLSGASHVLGADPAAAGVQALAWLSGCWQQRSRPSIVEEQWMVPRGGTLVGMNRTTRNGKTIEHEALRIYEDNGRLVYVAHPSGQALAEFRSRQVGLDAVVFENPSHDFPQTITYSRVGGDALEATVEGTTGGRVRTLRFRFQRVPCTLEAATRVP